MSEVLLFVGSPKKLEDLKCRGGRIQQGLTLKVDQHIILFQCCNRWEQPCCLSSAPGVSPTRYRQLRLPYLLRSRPRAVAIHSPPPPPTVHARRAPQGDWRPDRRQRQSPTYRQHVVAMLAVTNCSRAQQGRCMRSRAPCVVEGLGFVPEGRSETPARTLRSLVAAAVAAVARGCRV